MSSTRSIDFLRGPSAAVLIPNLAPDPNEHASRRPITRQYHHLYERRRWRHPCNPSHQLKSVEEIR
jgi:hypothetical protein